MSVPKTNVGTKLSNGSVSPTNDTLIEKWCYGNNDINNGSGGCLTGSSPGLGGLYNWPEANCLPSSCGTTTCALDLKQKGICPVGWHIPTDAEWRTLEIFYDPACLISDPVCWNAGLELKKILATSFSAYLAGARSFLTGNIVEFNLRTYFGTSTQNGNSNAYYRYLRSDTDTSYRDQNSKLYGYSVRCIKD